MPYWHTENDWLEARAYQLKYDLMSKSKLENGDCDVVTKFNESH